MISWFCKKRIVALTNRLKDLEDLYNKSIGIYSLGMHTKDLFSSPREVQDFVLRQIVVTKEKIKYWNRVLRKEDMTK
jgi:hypothetical protein